MVVMVMEKMVAMTMEGGGWGGGKEDSQQVQSLQSGWW